MSSKKITQAAELIDAADALFIGAGAGMGVDSGLPDFRGDQGFWRAYPAFEELGLSFVELANPAWFRDDPALAWGFYGHRLHLYRDTTPHVGFELLREWGDSKKAGSFVFTSNVDGQFQAANFSADRILECHGSIHHLQCSAGCGESVWSAKDETIDFDKTSFRAAQPLPRCPDCAGLARPNILMFNDFGFTAARTDRQEARLLSWLHALQRDHAQLKLVVIECGAGTAVPSVRWQSERLMTSLNAALIRVNPREAHGPKGTISLPMPAAEALTQIDRALKAGS